MSGADTSGSASAAFRTRGQAWWRKGKRYQKDADAALEGKHCLQATGAGWMASAAFRTRTRALGRIGGERW